MFIISMHIYIVLTDQYPKGFSDLVKTMECNGMNKYVQFCLHMTDCVGFKKEISKFIWHIITHAFLR